MKRTKLLACLMIILTCTNFIEARSMDEAYVLGEEFCKSIKAKEWNKARSYIGDVVSIQLEKDIKNVESNPKEFEKELALIKCEIEEFHMVNEKQSQLYKIYFKNFDRVHIEKRDGVLKVIRY